MEMNDILEIIRADGDKDGKGLPESIIVENITDGSKGRFVRGLKDHEIQELVNLLRDRIRPISEHQCLREFVHGVVTGYLERKGLRIDK
jgi:hypothetical protein